MSKVAYVDKDECTSCNQCADNLPKYFRMDDDDIAETHLDGGSANAAEVADGDIDAMQNEIDECPGECIKWK